MNNFVNIKDIEPSFNHGHYSYPLLDNGKLSETGVSVYTTKEYQVPGVHEFSEGFYVLEGKGFIKCDSDEYFIEEGMSFIVQAGIGHSIRCDEDMPEVKVFWFHLYND